MKPANNKTFDRVSKLITESPYPMNTLRISFPYEFVAKATDLNWYDILFAIEQGFLEYQAAIEHAKIILEGDEYPQAVLDLACIYPDEAVSPNSIHPYIDELADTVDAEEKSKTKDKIMYVLLKWVYEHGVNLNNPFYDDNLLNVAESIWHDFGFPKSIARFASWRNLPASMVEPDLGSVEKNVARLLDHWKQFLDEQESKWKKPL